MFDKIVSHFERVRIDRHGVGRIIIWNNPIDENIWDSRSWSLHLFVYKDEQFYGCRESFSQFGLIKEFGLGPILYFNYFSDN